MLNSEKSFEQLLGEEAYRDSSSLLRAKFGKDTDFKPASKQALNKLVEKYGGNKA